MRPPDNFDVTRTNYQVTQPASTKKSHSSTEIEQIKQSINNGTYAINAKNLADKITKLGLLNDE